MQSLGGTHAVAAGRRGGVRPRTGRTPGGRQLRSWPRKLFGRWLPEAARLSRRARWDAVQSTSDIRAPGQARTLAPAEPDTAIAQLVSRLVSEYAGPRSRARTYLAEDVVTVILEGTLTKGEERLVRAGMGELVLSTRRAFQHTMRQDLVAGIEQITHRKVCACADEMRPDIAVEVLVLAGSGSHVDGSIRRRP